MYSRRSFLTTGVGSASALLLATCAPPAPPTTPPASDAAQAPHGTAGTSAGTAPLSTPAVLQGATVSLLQWNSFIPTADPFFKQQATDWGQQTGVAITIETINGNDLVPRFTAALQGQSGPTIFQMQSLGPHAFAAGLYDLTDLAQQTSEVFARYVVANMFARAAVQGMSPESSVQQAEAEMRQIYA
jgi:ABC-type glycerol-3-phosphate transport system substrate-binding protein